MGEDVTNNKFGRFWGVDIDKLLRAEELTQKLEYNLKILVCDNGRNTANIIHENIRLIKELEDLDSDYITSRSILLHAKHEVERYRKVTKKNPIPEIGGAAEQMLDFIEINFKSLLSWKLKLNRIIIIFSFLYPEKYREALCNDLLCKMDKMKEQKIHFAFRFMIILHNLFTSYLSLFTSRISDMYEKRKEINKD